MMHITVGELLTIWLPLGISSLLYCFYVRRESVSQGTQSKAKRWLPYLGLGSIPLGVYLGEIVLRSVQPAVGACILFIVAAGLIVLLDRFFTRRLDPENKEARAILKKWRLSLRGFFSFIVPILLCLLALNAIPATHQYALLSGFLFLVMFAVLVFTLIGIVRDIRQERS